jgi:hypothetical protein
LRSVLVKIVGFDIKRFFVNGIFGSYFEDYPAPGCGVAACYCGPKYDYLLVAQATNDQERRQ